MNITLTGNLGSGKSSVCKELKKFGHEIISAGDIFRNIAQERGLTVTELNEQAKKDSSIDDMLDHRTMELDAEKDNVVFDSRLAWHFTKNSFKVFLMVEADEAANRVFHGAARNAEIYQSVEEAGQGLLKRAQLEQERYQQLYQVDYYDTSNYDLVIESTNASPEELAKEIESCFLEYQKHPYPTRIELNLRELYPLHRLGQEIESQAKGRANEEKKTEKLCMSQPVSVTEHMGYHCIENPSQLAEVAAAIQTGKVFALAESIRKEGSGLKMLSPDELDQYQKLGNFTYHGYPDCKVRKGYQLKFPV